MTQEPQVTGKSIPIDWQVPDGLQTHFVNKFTMQHIEHEFVLTFYQLLPPPLLGPLGDEKLQEINAVPAVAVARIAIPQGYVPGIVRAMQEFLQKNTPELLAQQEDGDE